MSTPPKEKKLTKAEKRKEAKIKADVLTQLQSVDITALNEADRADLNNFLVGHLVEESKTNFYAYVQFMAPTIIFEGFRDGRHIKKICNELQLLAEAVMLSRNEMSELEYSLILKEHSRRLQVFLPPGGMKSILCSRLFPSWCFGRWNHFRVIQIGYAIEFAKDNYGRPLLELLRSDQYRELFPDVKLKVGVQSAERFQLTGGGTYVCSGVGAAIAGKRAHITICDDAMSEQSATSATDRKNINSWYVPGLRSRLTPRPLGGEIMVMTRWRIDDLCGHMVDTDEKSPRPWRIIKIPAILDEEASDYLREEGDPEDYLAEGASFWPELWPTSLLEETKFSAKPSDWNALYMQNPVPEGGVIISRDDIKIWEEPKPPKCSMVIVSLDTAYSQKERADYSAYSVWGVFIDKGINKETGMAYNNGNNTILLDAEKGRWDFPELCQVCEDLFENIKPDVFVIERKGSGITLVQELERRGFPIVGVDPRADKETRMHVASAYTESGRVWSPPEVWARDFLEEVCLFPSTTHDDFADTFSQAMIYLRDRFKIAHPDATYGAYGDRVDEEDEDGWGREYQAFGDVAKTTRTLEDYMEDEQAKRLGGSQDMGVSTWDRLLGGF